MRIGSLFSGAAGLDRAVEQVFGAEVAWFAEIDKAASKVLAYHYPDVPNLGDITAVDWADVPPVDILCGGFPCQDVSAAGKRAGIKDGTRSGLWSVFADAIDALRPRYVVIENVRGLLSAAAERTVDDGDSLEFGAPVVGDGSGGPVLRAAGAVCGDLADLGYDAQWATVAAADVGAPHRRERVFIVACAADTDDVRLQANQFAVGRQPSLAGTGTGVASLSGDAADSPCDGWDEGRPEPARLVGGLDAAVRGDGHGVDLLPTPTQSDGTGGGIRTGLSWDGTTKSTGDGGNSRLRDVVGLLLPTPIAADAGGSTLHPDRRKELNPKHSPELSELARHGLLGGDGHGVDLLPTPAARDCKGHGPAGMRRNSPNMSAIADLLPTPSTHDKTGARSPESIQKMDKPFSKLNDTVVNYLPTPSLSDTKTPRRGEHLNDTLENGTHTVNLSDAVEQHHGRDVAVAQWGKYEPAIRRWEQVTRPAPAPTEPNKNGNPRLSAEFSSWLMGWPDGWVTDPAIGISRNDQLRIVGNGVCSQQAVAALRYLLAVTA